MISEKLATFGKIPSSDLHKILLEDARRMILPLFCSQDRKISYTLVLNLNKLLLSTLQNVCYQLKHDP